MLISAVLFLSLGFAVSGEIPVVPVSTENQQDRCCAIHTKLAGVAAKDIRR